MFMFSMPLVLFSLNACAMQVAAFLIQDLLAKFDFEWPFRNLQVLCHVAYAENSTRSSKCRGPRFLLHLMATLRTSTAARKATRKGGASAKVASSSVGLTMRRLLDD